ncbi:MAG: dihydropteroate synthase [Candidatus Margulisbacteria bacterium]|nr:dihydropteroate synthase [Candidatus Margulisiibacteriota bacterium]
MIPRVIDPSLAKEEMRLIGCDPAGIRLMSPKAQQFVIKLDKIRVIAANIIKQEMLSFGGEAATGYGAIDHSAKTTDILLIGNQKQLALLVKKMRAQQFGLPVLASQITEALTNYEKVLPKLRIGEKTFTFGRRTYIMGILNVTPDSFSDGGKFNNIDAALEQAEQMLEVGADIIDIGGESTRPGAKPVSATEEIQRVIPIIKKLARTGRAVISIDTRRAVVAQAALAAGADMINDISGLRHDRKMAGVIARHKVPVCLMHIQGTPRNMQTKPAYHDLMGEIISYLEESIAIAGNAGILHGKIIVDPGIGFGKTAQHNLEIFRRLKELRVLGCPVLIGPSRKATIGQVLDLPVTERVEGTAAAVALSIANGAEIVRVHDVKEMVRVARMTDAIIRRK